MSRAWDPFRGFLKAAGSAVELLQWWIWALQGNGRVGLRVTRQIPMESWEIVPALDPAHHGPLSASETAASTH